MDRLNQIGGLWLATLLTGTLAFEVSGQTNLPPLIPVTDATNYMYQQVVVRDVVVQVALRSTVALLNLNIYRLNRMLNNCMQRYLLKPEFNFLFIK